MKTLTHKYGKRMLSIVLAIAMLIGTVFTANSAVNIKADAETDTTLNIWYWDGGYESISTTAHTGTANDPYVIENAKQLNYVAMKIGNSASEGKYYKIADGVDAIVLQPESVAANIMALSSSTEVKTYFEKNTSNLKDWMANCGWNVFDGNFDGNGVPIYGLYATNNITTTDGGCALFPRVDGGVSGSDGTPNTDNVGVDYKNVIIRNSYFSATGKPVGAIIGLAYGSAYVAYVYGAINIDTAEVSNCYIATTGTNVVQGGVVVGQSQEDLIRINKALVYGNSGTDGNGYNLPLLGKGCGDRKVKDSEGNLSTGSTEADYEYNTVKNSVIFGTNPYNINDFNYRTANNNGRCYFNVYTDAETQDVSFNSGKYTKSYADTEMKKVLPSNAKGAIGKSSMPNLVWATDTTDGDWYAIDGDYPTPFKPDGWKDVENIPIWDGTTATEFFGGTGTESDPYTIATVAQLHKMVIDGGKKDGNAAYYKVADGVKSLYINYVTTHDEIVTLVNSGSYNAWTNGGTSNSATNTFDGIFDGNGATIYGMVSVNAATPGFVSEIGYNAQINNVNFAAAYVTGVFAAVISTKGKIYNRDIEAYSYVKNVTVRQSYIKSTNTSTSGGTAVAAGFMATTDTPDCLTFINCLYDGSTCTLVDGNNSSDGTQRSIAGIAAFPNWGNNIKLRNCVSINAYLVSMVSSMAEGYITSTNNNGATTYSYSWYERYTSDANENGPGIVEIVNCYSPVNPVMYNTVKDAVEITDGTATRTVDRTYDKIINGITPVEIQSDKKYDESVFPTLDFLNTWKLVELADGTILPMPIGKNTTGELENSYDSIIGNLQSGRGANNGKPYADGTYGMYHELTGSGTEADPYIIDSAIKLACAIGSGGVNLNDKLYYKLACDIDLTGYNWITQTTYKDINGNVRYAYVSFAGALDGDGHTITGLVSGDRNAAGLIPVLNGGTVKNLRIENSYVGAITVNSTGAITDAKGAGAIAGSGNGTVENCAVYNTAVNNTLNTIAGSSDITVKNCTVSEIVTDTATNTSSVSTSYVGVDGTPTADYNGSNGDTATWYCGGAEGSQPQLVVNATTSEAIYGKNDNKFKGVDTYVDVNGDGVSTTYDATDLTAMRFRLARKTGYKNVYGDVNCDGKINTGDLVILKRAMALDYADLEDGFWRNVALGNVGIYYAENDTYDMARSLELYLEQSVPGVDVIKYAGSAVTDRTVKNTYTDLPTKNAIIVTCTNNGTANSTTDKEYTVTFDNKNNLVTISGGSFTAVEAAANKFMSDSNALTNAVYTGSGTLSDTYASKTVNGTTYYYAWGDEFNEGESYSTNNWDIQAYKYKTEDSNGNEVKTGRYLNKVNANVEDLSKLYVVNDGKLTIWRGVNADATTVPESTYGWGYKKLSMGTSGKNDFGQTVDANDVYVDAGLLVTSSSMLFKQGYVEMKATLPSDGYAFPAWWFLTAPGHKNNSYYDSTLYSKVYLLNNSGDKKWTGTDKMLAKDLSTYKYKIPTAHLEYDIMELMQYDEVTEGNWATDLFGTSKEVTLTGSYKTNLYLTVHKIYDENSLNGTLYIPDWSTGTAKEWTEKFISTGGGEFVHRYKANTGTFTYDFGSTGTLKNEHVFGFEWKVNQNDNQNESTYSIKVYIDGIECMNISQDDIHDSAYGKDPTHTSGGDDADLWNQYAFMLLDNSYYTSSESTKYTREDRKSDWVGDGVTSQFTKLLSQETGDTAQFTIDYVRVYQQDNMRDIVTRETEAFNTGNHFGYGVN